MDVSDILPVFSYTDSTIHILFTIRLIFYK